MRQFGSSVSRQPGLEKLLPQKGQTPTRFSGWGFGDRSLTMTYSHMGKPHTTIGDASFHY